MTGIGVQFGRHSLEHIEASGYWLDLLDRRRKVADNTIHRASILAHRELIADTVAADVWPVYERYIEHYLLG